MGNQPDDTFQANLRSKLRTALQESDLGLEDLALELGFNDPAKLREVLKGERELTLAQLKTFADALGRPAGWFFGEQPKEMTVENAETALANLARAKLYLEAVELEFQQLLARKAPTNQARPALPGSSRESGTSPGPQGPSVVVDFAPYLSRARAILEREAEFTEDSEEIFEESVEMVAQSLYSLELASPLKRSEPEQNA